MSAKIAFIGAMMEEIEEVCRSLDSHNYVDSEQLMEELMPGSAVEGQFEGVDIVVGLSGIGKTAASGLTQQLIDRYPLDYVVNIGVAGATSSELNRGDVLVPEGAFHHDFDISSLMDVNPGEHPDYDPNFPEEARKKAEEAVSAFINSQRDWLSESQYDPELRSGLIATGDQYIDDEDEIKAILKTRPSTKAVDMESGAINQIAKKEGVSVLSIRAISDPAWLPQSQEIFYKFVRNYGKLYIKSLLEELLPLIS